MKSNKNKLYTRKFLNGSTGLALIEVDMTKNAGGSICISDCSRNISLDLYIYSEDGSRSNKQRRTCVKKLNVLIDSLTEARDFLNSDIET